jgi:putative transposase
MFEFVDVERAHHPVTRLCRLLGVSASGYYAWRTRPASAHAVADARLSRHIRAVYERSRCTYGAPRVHAELRADGIRTGRKRIARLMRQAGLAGCHRRRGVRTTRRAPEQAPAPDLVRRQFRAEQPNATWVADITYVPTWAGFLYLAVVLDVFSRRVVGWAMASHLRTELVLAALNMAIAQRRPRSGLIHHSDQGCQYTSLAFGRRLREAGIAASMGSRGDCFDNALCESFFATLECELLDRSAFPTRTDARLAIFEWIEAFYNTHRRHSALGYLSPADFERRYTPAADLSSTRSALSTAAALISPSPRAPLPGATTTATGG